MSWCDTELSAAADAIANKQSMSEQYANLVVVFHELDYDSDVLMVVLY